MQTLIELAIKNGTDKQGGHSYAGHYDHHFSPFRDKSISILEIGIGGYDDPTKGGESLRMWRDYFPYGKIVGLDYYDKENCESDRIRVYKGSQDDRALLERIEFENSGFDLIVDDGSHMNEHVIASFNILFPLLRIGGIYAVEDLQTSYWAKVFGGSTTDLNNSATSMGYFKSLLDGINYPEYERPGYVPSYFDRHIVSMHFYRNLVFVYKGYNNEPSNILKDNRLPDQYSSFPLSIE